MSLSGWRFLVLGAASMAIAVPAKAAEWLVVYTGEGFYNTAGGLERGGGYLGNLDATVEWGDLSWFGDGGSAMLYVLGNHGASPSERIGDAQTYSNIDAPQSLKLYEAWYEQPFAAGAATWKFGLIDLNSEFDVVSSAGLFQNSSFGIGPDFSQSGVNGPSIFPTTSLGLRLLWGGTGGTYAACIVLDGVPGDPDNPRGTHVDVKSADGWLGTCEVGNEKRNKSGQVRKFNLGYWTYSEPTARFDGASTARNRGWYASFDQRLWRLGEEEALYGFVRVGMADDTVNAFDRFRSGGLHWIGPFTDDGSDALGLAVARVENGNPFRRWQAAEGATQTGHETAIELTYRFVVTEWLALQPSIQHIRHPGMNPELSSATAVSLRFEVGFGGAS
ncbi:MAG TPA: carbohydrate porin [Permianibacter sp.]|nr:carbohydrate porin [Permianibacter sp.]